MYVKDWQMKVKCEPMQRYIMSEILPSCDGQYGIFRNCPVTTIESY